MLIQSSDTTNRHEAPQSSRHSSRGFILLGLCALLLAFYALNSTLFIEIIAQLPENRLDSYAIEALPKSDPRAVEILLNFLETRRSYENNQSIEKKLRTVDKATLLEALRRRIQSRRMADPSDRARFYDSLRKISDKVPMLVPDLRERAKLGHREEIYQIAAALRGAYHHSEGTHCWSADCSIVESTRHVLEADLKSKDRRAVELIQLLRDLRDESPESIQIVSLAISMGQPFLDPALGFLSSTGPKASHLIPELTRQLSYEKKRIDKGFIFYTILSIAKSDENRLEKCLKTLIESNHHYFRDIAYGHLSKLHETMPLAVAEAVEAKRAELRDGNVESLREQIFDDFMCLHYPFVQLYLYADEVSEAPPLKPQRTPRPSPAEVPAGSPKD